MRRELLHKSSILLLLLALISIKAIASGDLTSDWKQWNQLSSDSLLSMSLTYYDAGKADSALMCATIVTNRYKKGLGQKEESLCAKGYYREGIIHINCYADYGQAYACMKQATEIYEKQQDKDMLIRTNIYLGNLSLFYSIQFSSNEMAEEGFRLYRSAMHTAAERQQWSNLMIAFNNIASSAPEIAEKQNILDDVLFFQQQDIPDSIPMLAFSRQLADGIKLMYSHRFDEAITTFHDVESSITDSTTQAEGIRFRLIPLTHIAESYNLMGDNANAVIYMKKCEELALSKLELTDVLPEIYLHITDYYSAEGNQTAYQEYRIKYLEIKDQIATQNGLGNVKDLMFKYEFSNLNAQLTEANHQRDRHRILLCSCLTVLLVVIVFLIIVSRKNRELELRNKALYEHMQEALEKQQEPISQQMAKTSHTISDEQKDLMLQKLNTLLADPSVLCASDLTEASLAKQIGSNSSYLSKLINEFCQCNFSTFLSNLRIQEACKRIADKEHYGHYTIEGIGTSVGFNSRTSFRNAFKRVTGLSPSEYMKEARNE